MSKTPSDSESTAKVFSSPFTPVNPRITGVREGYDLWADIYDGESNSLVLLEEEHLPLIFNGLDYKNILDLGCGTGRISGYLTQRFPDAHITGVDISSGMLKKARIRNISSRIKWLQMDLEKPFSLDSYLFDLVISSLVVEHIENLQNYFSEIMRTTAPDGDIIISGLHPFMHVMGVTARFKLPGTDSDILPKSFAHSMSAIINSAIECGLSIQSVSEYQVNAHLAERCPRAARYLGLPLLFILQGKACR